MTFQLPFNIIQIENSKCPIFRPRETLSRIRYLTPLSATYLVIVADNDSVRVMLPIFPQTFLVFVCAIVTMPYIHGQYRFVIITNKYGV